MVLLLCLQQMNQTHQFIKVFVCCGRRELLVQCEPQKIHVLDWFRL